MFYMNFFKKCFLYLSLITLVSNVNSINDMNIDEQILQEVPEEGDNWDPFEDN